MQTRKRTSSRRHTRKRGGVKGKKQGTKRLNKYLATESHRALYEPSSVRTREALTEYAKNVLSNNKKKKIGKRTIKILNTIKNTTTNNSDLDNLKVYKLCLKFIKKIIKNYKSVMENNNEDKKSNYSAFMSMLAANISTVNNNYAEIIDEDKLLNNSNNTLSYLAEYPDKYLENYLEAVEDIEKDYDNAFENQRNDPSMYLEYYNFVKDSLKEIKNTLKSYASMIKNNSVLNNGSARAAMVMENYGSAAAANSPKNYSAALAGLPANKAPKNTKIDMSNMLAVLGALNINTSSNNEFGNLLAGLKLS
jgi:hypothetical protein